MDALPDAANSPLPEAKDAATRAKRTVPVGAGTARRERELIGLAAEAALEIGTEGGIVFHTDSLEKVRRKMRRTGSFMRFSSGAQVDRFDRLDRQNIRVGDGLSLHERPRTEAFPWLLCSHEIGGNSLELVVVGFRNVSDF